MGVVVPYHTSVEFISLDLAEIRWILECDWRQLRALPNSSPKCSRRAELGSLLEQVGTASGTRWALTGLVNVLFSLPIRKEDQERFTFTWNGQ